MMRFVCGAVALAALLTGHASAQYVGQYRGHGFWYDDWGNPVANAVANRINADTDMKINDYVYACYKSVLKEYNDRHRAHKQLTNENQVATLKRLRENPDIRDVERGSALNVIMAELLNPKGSLSELRTIRVDLDVRTIQQIPFAFRGQGVKISLRRLSVKKVDWPKLLQADDFQRERQLYVKAVEQALEQNLREDGLKPDTILAVAKAVRNIKNRVQEVVTRKPEYQRFLPETGSFIARLKSAADFLDRKVVTDVIADLDRFSGTTLVDLLEFMRNYHLTFAPAESPKETELYASLFEQLKEQRQKYAKLRPELFPDEPLIPPDPSAGPRVVPSR